MNNTIRSLREKAGISQCELAKRMGVTQGAVWQWENGMSHPKIPLLKRLAETLGVTVDELISKESA